MWVCCQLRAVETRAEDPQRHVGIRSGYGFDALARAQRTEEGLQLEHVLRERVGRVALAAQRAQGQRIGAGRAAEAEVDAARVHGLEHGELLGVATTNALELGVDISGLDAVIVAGYPGTVASFWQLAGRAGRRGEGSLVVLVARDDPLDTYLVHHPAALLGKPVENSVFDPSNPFILRGHVYCAAVERPLTEADVAAFGARDVVDDLTGKKLGRASSGTFRTADVVGLDSGCVWGGKLTAMCLDDRALLQVDCPEYRPHAGKA